MANSFTTQILEEGPRNAVVKLTGVLDTSNLASTVAVDPANFNMSGTGQTPTQFRIDEIEYSISDQLEVQLLWDATAPVVIVAMAGREDIGSKKYGGLQNNAGAGKTGKISVQTTGWASGIQIFTIVLRLVKQGTNL